MENITQVILKFLKNDHTKIEIKDGFMGNYYSPLIDTIFIAKDFENRQKPVDAIKINDNVARLIALCHECIHSVQNKIIHLLNTILSNLSIIFFIVNIFVSLFFKQQEWLKVSCIVIIILSIIARLFLEVGAVNGSTKLATELVNNKIVNEITNQDIEEGKKYINKHKLLALLQMISDKIVFLIATFVI